MYRSFYSSLSQLFFRWSWFLPFKLLCCSWNTPRSSLDFPRAETVAMKSHSTFDKLYLSIACVTMSSTWSWKNHFVFFFFWWGVVCLSERESWQKKHMLPPPITLVRDREIDFWNRWKWEGIWWRRAEEGGTSFVLFHFLLWAVPAGSAS